MSAKRVIDDHLELANIGTKTHAEIDTHIADPSAHHVKYTDAEAVTAVATVDKYIKNDDEDTINMPDDDKITFKKGVRCGIEISTLDGSSHLPFIDFDSNHPGYRTKCRFISGSRMWWDVWPNGASSLIFSLSWGDGTYPAFGTRTYLLTITKIRADWHGLIMKNFKNHAYSALSGTKKLIEVDIGGVPYYYEVYPTKA